MHHLYFIKKLGYLFVFRCRLFIKLVQATPSSQSFWQCCFSQSALPFKYHGRLFPCIDGFTVLDAWLKCATDHFTLLTVSTSYNQVNGRMNWPCQFSPNKILNISCLHYFGCFIFRKIITTYNVLFRAYTRQKANFAQFYTLHSQ